MQRAGGWYANVSRPSEEGERAYEFTVWFEEQLAADTATAQALPYDHPISLWLRQTPRLPALAYRTPAVWRAISDLLPLVARDDFRGWGSVRISTLHGRDLGLYDPALKADGEANLLMAKAWDIADECVTLFWMPRLEKKILEQANEELARTAEMLKSVTPEVPRLEAGTLPRPPRDDARFSQIARDADPSLLASFLEAARTATTTVHDHLLGVLQEYLRVSGQNPLPGVVVVVRPAGVSGDSSDETDGLRA